MSKFENSEGNDPLKTFWVGDLPETLLEDVVRVIKSGTCWCDGISGPIESDVLLRSLLRLQAGLPIEAGDRLLVVRGRQTEFNICMENEKDGKLKLKHWSGNGSADGWMDEPREVDAMDYRIALLGDMQIITLALFAVETSFSDQFITFDERGKKMLMAKGCFSEGRRKLYEDGDFNGIDEMLAALDVYLGYEGVAARDFPEAAATSEMLTFDQAFKFLRARYERKTTILFFVKELLSTFRNNLNSQAEVEKGSLVGDMTGKIKDACKSGLSTSTFLHV